MIFVTIGTHPGQFDRLLRRIDEIAPKVNEKIIIQRGFTKYKPKNCESFEFTENIDDYYKKARLVIVQSATSLLEFVLKYKKPAITVPRRKKYGEHLNDHQVEFGVYFSQKTGIPCILNIADLTPEMLNTYNSIPKINNKELLNLQDYFRNLFIKLNKQLTPQKPYAHDRDGYILNLLDPKRSDKILNVGISNIPEIEMFLENNVKECVTLDFDKEKLAKASKFLNKTKLIKGDVTNYNGFRKNYFDKVVVLEVLEHLKKDEFAVQWINSIMKKNGQLIVSVPNTALIHYVNPVKYTEHERHYSKKRIVELLERNGFKIEHFNVVERWTLIANVYIHVFFKYLLRKQVPFGLLKRLANNSYGQNNKKGLDIIIKARKI